MTHSCPNGAAHTSPGQRPGNQATHISAFSRNAADGRITHPRPNDAAPERCGARTMRRSYRAHPYPSSVSLMHTHRPCPGCIPTVRVPDAYPPSVSRMHAHRPCPGCMPTVRVPDACPSSVSRMHAHRPCPGCIPTVRVPDACPPSHPQGCTLGWYALPLWGKWNAAGCQSPTCRPRPSRRFESGATPAQWPWYWQGGEVGWNVEERRRAASEYTRQELNLRPTDSKSGALSN